MKLLPNFITRIIKDMLGITKIFEVDYMVEASHTYVVTIEEDENGDRIKIGFTDDAKASAFAIGYCSKLQKLADGKFIVCLQLDKCIINYLIGLNNDQEIIQKILKARDDGKERAERDIFRIIL